MKKYQIPERYCKACTSFIEAEDMKTFACPICGCDYGVVETDDEDLSTGDKIEIITAFLNTASIEDVDSVYDGLFDGDDEGVYGSFKDLTRNTPVGKRFKWRGSDFLVESAELGGCSACVFYGNFEGLCELAVCMPSERLDNESVIFNRE